MPYHTYEKDVGTTDEGEPIIRVYDLDCKCGCDCKAEGTIPHPITIEKGKVCSDCFTGLKAEVIWDKKYGKGE